MEHSYVNNGKWITYVQSNKREDAIFFLGDHVCIASLILISSGEYMSDHELIVKDCRTSEVVFKKQIITFSERGNPVLEELFDEHIVPLIRNKTTKRKRAKSNLDEEEVSELADKYLKIN